MNIQTKVVKVHIHFQMLHKLVQLINMEFSYNINIASKEILLTIGIISFNDKYLLLTWIQLLEYLNTMSKAPHDNFQEQVLLYSLKAKIWKGETIKNSLR